MASNQTADTLKEVRAWITPFLILVVGYFSKSKLEEIEASVKLIPGVQAEITVNAVNIAATTGGLNDLRGQFIQYVELTGKHEKDITIDEPKRPLK